MPFEIAFPGSSPQAAFEGGFSALGFDVPWRARLEGMLDKAIKGESGKLRATVDRWMTAFPKTPLFKEADVVTSTLVPQMGSADLHDLKAKCLPDELCVKMSLPSFQTLTDTWRLYGEAGTFCAYDFEQMFLGSLRVQLRGHSKYVMYPPSAFMTACFGTDPATLKNVQLPTILERFKNLTPDDIDRLKANGCPAYYTELGPSEVLYIPPAWLVGQTTMQGQVVACFRRACLVSSSTAVRAAEGQLLALSKLGMQPTSRQHMRSMLDILGVEKSQKSEQPGALGSEKTEDVEMAAPAEKTAQGQGEAAD